MTTCVWTAFYALTLVAQTRDATCPTAAPSVTGASLGFVQEYWYEWRPWPAFGFVVVNGVWTGLISSYLGTFVLPCPS